MEHRWGRRIPIGIRVRLDGVPGAAAATGRVRDLSLSGAYIECIAAVPLWSAVTVVFDHSEPAGAQGCVVRNGVDGFAIEWCEFAPRTIRALLQRHEQSVVPCRTRVGAIAMQIQKRSGAGVRAALCAGLLACIACARAAAQDIVDLSSYTGAELYKEYCASCHGAQGHGDGPVASSLKVEVPDLTRIAARQGAFPAERLRTIIDGRTTMPPHGTREMPVWGWAFRASSRGGDPQAEYRTQAFIGLLVDYLRSIQQK